MPARSWLAELRSRFGAGGARADGLGILAFEAAATMSRLVSLHRTLSDVEFRRLRADVLRAEGVARLTSPDQSFLLRLACCELVADLDRAAATVARLAARCRSCAEAPLLRDFDRLYAEAKRGRLAQLDVAVGFSRGAGKRLRKMERHVAAAARLYEEMDALRELEASERRMENWKQHSGPIIPSQAAPGKKPAAEPGEKLMHELRAQRHKVRRLMEGSLWSVDAGRAAKLMAKSVLAVLARISIAFGPFVPGLPSLTVGRAPGHSSGPLHRSAMPGAALRHSVPIFGQKDAALSVLESTKPLASTIGGSGMELRYANLILSVKTLLAALRPPAADGEEVQEGMMDLSARDGLYKMLPVSIREAVNAKLRESWRGQAVDEEAAKASRGEAEVVLRWLGPMAHDTVRWSDERSMERGQRFSMQPRALMVQTLHFADRKKADAAIVDVLVCLSCVCWYDDERRRLESVDWDDE
ncbi:hypothetical protein SETIT_9G460900v2 [Setaria italica]|uniref:DUF668 domain-containing protein n=1 Tax=Setaria italica TaxID=4555 RepID=K4A9G3_SETIT|nr:uncharacterized protein LOC101768536 [Setaria italica]RCV45519.1 hypothetical protein SETIT_9G460900v2 [Setaria italica]